MKSLAALAGEWPVLDPQRCTACGWCVLICPTQCLQSGPIGPWLARPLDCLACAACVRLCPYHALQMISSALHEVEQRSGDPSSS